MCQNVDTEPVEVLFYIGWGFIPSLKARVFTPTFEINVADLPSRKLGICAKLLQGLSSEAALRR